MWADLRRGRRVGDLCVNDKEICSFPFADLVQDKSDKRKGKKGGRAGKEGAKERESPPLGHRRLKSQPREKTAARREGRGEGGLLAPVVLHPTKAGR